LFWAFNKCYWIAINISGRFSYPRTGPHDRERSEIKAMVENGTFPCLVLQSSDGIAANPQLGLLEYLILVGQTVFAPAPAGNGACLFIYAFISPTYEYPYLYHIHDVYLIMLNVATISS
jgi:hypothetical protein